MNKSPFLAKLIATLMLALCASAGAQLMEAQEYAAEMEIAEFGNAPTAGGLVYIKRCDQCPKTGVTFRAQTRFFDGRRAISAVAAERLAERGATLLFDPETRYVTRVIYWPAN
ncbi:MAG: hypothetical protein AB8G18_18000 [Gammaproteobacteria bacterium]